MIADAPTTWPDEPSLSTLETLLVFVGIPLLASAVIALLVMAPSLARGPRYRPTEKWEGESEWFGAPAEIEGPDEAGRRALAGRGTSAEQPTPVARPTSTGQPSSTEQAAPEETGGASARW